MSYFFGNKIQTAVSHLFCMQFSAMHFSTKVFEHTKSLGGITVMLIA